jgi:hypothetical protein
MVTLLDILPSLNKSTEKDISVVNFALDVPRAHKVHINDHLVNDQTAPPSWIKHPN